MATKKQTGYLVIGDISGYTSYVASTELEHAQEILSELLALILRKFQPVLRLAKFEGDAVFAVAPGESIKRGESVLEIIESTYVAFRDRVDGIHRRTTCTCRACSAIPTLDLKFMLHYGDYIVSDIGHNHQETVGTDVNLLHRLTKNTVMESTGWEAYSLFTAEALEAMGISGEGMTRVVESYDHLGEIETFNIDLHERYETLTSERLAFVEAEDADIVLGTVIDAPRSIVWEWLNDPNKRRLYIAGSAWSAITRPGGRTTVGATNHCAHGDDELLVENMLDWRPYDYYTCESYDHGEENGDRNISTYMLTALENDDGLERTKIDLHMQILLKNPNPINKFITKMMMRYLGFGPMLRKVKELIENDVSVTDWALEIPEISFPNAGAIQE